MDVDSSLIQTAAWSRKRRLNQKEQLSDGTDGGLSSCDCCTLLRQLLLQRPALCGNRDKLSASVWTCPQAGRSSGRRDFQLLPTELMQIDSQGLLPHRLVVCFWLWLQIHGLMADRGPAGCWRAFKYLLKHSSFHWIQFYPSNMQVFCRTFLSHIAVLVMSCRGQQRTVGATEQKLTWRRTKVWWKKGVFLIEMILKLNLVFFFIICVNCRFRSYQTFGQEIADAVLDLILFHFGGKTCTCERSFSACHHFVLIFCVHGVKPTCFFSAVRHEIQSALMYKLHSQPSKFWITSAFMSRAILGLKKLQRQENKFHFQFKWNSSGRKWKQIT